MSHGNDDEPSIESLPPEVDGQTEDLHRTVEVNVGAATELIHVEKCKLVVVEGPERGKSTVVDKPIIRIGTNEKNDLVLTDNTVSRLHCEIRQVGDEYLLVDHQSTNGTYVGDLRLREVFLYPNCEVLIGNSLVRFTPVVDEIPVFPIARNNYGMLIGSASRMREIYGLIDKIAPSELSVVIEGETGTGKELVARAIHDRSRRSASPMVIFDCSAFPENLLESELFGHEKGSFSGAIRSHRGVFERADGGTVFFDELGELPLNMQPKFLRALETGEIRRVGAERTIKVDVRLVAATNRNLVTLVEDGKFRQDLFYRLAKVRFTLPPLRSRTGDLELLIDFFLVQLREREGHDQMRARAYAPDVIEALSRYDWPGNVRELRNVVERTATFAEGELVQLGDLPQELLSRLGHTKHPTPLVPAAGAQRTLKEAKEDMVARFERGYLQQLLDQHTNNISKVAREAGIDRRHVYRLLKKYDIPLPERME